MKKLFLTTITACVGLFASAQFSMVSSINMPEDGEGTVLLGNDTPNTGKYTVVSGDTLSGIAGRYKTTVDILVDLNSDIQDSSSIINVGQEIILPQSTQEQEDFEEEEEGGYDEEDWGAQDDPEVGEEYDEESYEWEQEEEQGEQEEQQEYDEDYYEWESTDQEIDEDYYEGESYEEEWYDDDDDDGVPNIDDPDSEWWIPPADEEEDPVIAGWS